MHFTDVQGDIIQIIRRLAREQPPQINETTAIEELGIDSLDKVEIVMAIESHYGITLDNDDELVEARTIGDLCKVVMEVLLAAQRPTLAMGL